eukprot:Nitzschia sp. Nitz4//scaffold23_size168460//123415//124982//NITZ4_002239-RA/size168460-processed-gene-0.233-mRNA-1//1//CDS//3329543695//1545//frame0
MGAPSNAHHRTRSSDISPRGKMLPPSGYSSSSLGRTTSHPNSLWHKLSSFLSPNILDQPTLTQGRVLVLVASCIYGSNFSVVKLVDDSMPLSLSAALRFSIAFGATTLCVMAKEEKTKDSTILQERQLAFWGGIEIGMWYCIGYIAQAEGMQTIPAGKSAFFNALAVVVPPVLDVLFRSKILQGVEILSILIACAGVGLLELGPTGDVKISFGDILAFMQTIFFGVGYWRLEEESHNHNEQAGRLTMGQLFAVAFGSIVYALSEFGLGHTNPEELPPDGLFGWMQSPFVIGALFWAGLMSTALALFLETVALKVVSATELTLLMTTTSLWGAVFAFATLGEILTPTGMFGGLMILGGCALGNIAKPPAPSKSLHSTDSGMSLEESKASPLVTMRSRSSSEAEGLFRDNHKSPV